VLIHLRFAFWVYIVVVLYPLVDLGYIEVVTTNSNNRFKAVAHCPVFFHFGKARGEKFGRSGNHHLNSWKIYQLTHRILTLLKVPTYLYPAQFMRAHEAKSTKVAQYPVTDNRCKIQIPMEIAEAVRIQNWSLTRGSPREIWIKDNQSRRFHWAERFTGNRWKGYSVSTTGILVSRTQWTECSNTLLPLYKLCSLSVRSLFKLRFWEIRPEALEVLGPGLWKCSINGASSGLLAPWSTLSMGVPIKVYTMPKSAFCSLLNFPRC
jgi:hypothetical protein